MGVESNAFVDSTVVAVSTGGSSTGVTDSTSFCSTGAKSVLLRAAGSWEEPFDDHQKLREFPGALYKPARAASGPAR